MDKWFYRDLNDTENPIKIINDKRKKKKPEILYLIGVTNNHPNDRGEDGYCIYEIANIPELIAQLQLAQIEYKVEKRKYDRRRKENKKVSSSLDSISITFNPNNWNGCMDLAPGILKMKGINSAELIIKEVNNEKR